MPAFPFRTRLLIGLTTLLVLASAGPSMAQRGIEGVVEGTGGLSIKVAVPDPQIGSGSPAHAQEIGETLRADLQFSGVFDVVDPSLYNLVPNTGETVRHDDWLSIGANALIRMRLEVRGSRVDLEARLYDNQGKTETFALRYGGQIELLRRVAHNLADDLVKHFTGEPGVAMTRIAFVSRHGDGKEIYLMDYDGRRVRRLTTSSTINLSPTWSPNGDELAYVSWRGRQPGVYVMSSTGEKRHIATIGGNLSAAPDWSHDARRLAYSSDFHGNTELYVLDRASGRNSRVTHTEAIDTAPAFSPNGRELAFTSDRGGTPQIYIASAEGLNTRRLSWKSSYADSAAWSPDGGRLIYVSRIDGRFDIVLLDLSSNELKRLTWGEGNNENPRFSPDGRHIVFASNRVGGSYQIYTMRSDGSQVKQLTRGRDSFTPDWSR